MGTHLLDSSDFGSAWRRFIQPGLIKLSDGLSSVGSCETELEAGLIYFWRRAAISGNLHKLVIRSGVEKSLSQLNSGFSKLGAVLFSAATAYVAVVAHAISEIIHHRLRRF